MALALNALTVVLLLLQAEETVGLYAWGSGSLAQIGLANITQMAPVIVVGVAGMALLARQLDILSPRRRRRRRARSERARARLMAVLGAVLLSAAAVTVAGPSGSSVCAPRRWFG